MLNKLFRVVLVLSLAFASLSFAAEAKDKDKDKFHKSKVKVDGRTIKFKYRRLDRIITEEDIRTEEAVTENVLDAAFNLYTKLIEGKIKEASELSNNPEFFVKNHEYYVKQIKLSEYTKLQKRLFEDKNVIEYEFLIDKMHMLVLNHPILGTRTAQYYVEDKESKFKQNLIPSETLDNLGRVFLTYKSGKLVLKH